MNVLLLCSAILVLLYAVLSLNVSRVRLKKRKDPDITEAVLTETVRAHGNAGEYVPVFVAAFLYLSSTPTGVAVSTIAVVATASRIAHAAGMLRAASVNQRNALRYYGALGTYISLFAVAAVLFQRLL